MVSTGWRERSEAGVRAVLAAAGVAIFTAGCGGSTGSTGSTDPLEDSMRDQRSPRFGASAALLGDIDGDGRLELAVGMPGFNGRTESQGAVDVVTLEPDGAVSCHQPIRQGRDGFRGNLDAFDHFGAAVAPLGDLNEDGVADLAVGAPHADSGGGRTGAVWLLFLRPDATVGAFARLGHRGEGLPAEVAEDDRFGSSLALLSAAPGTARLAVGAPGDATLGAHRGSVWVLDLDRNGAVAAARRIEPLDGGPTPRSRFGAALAPLGDLDGDGAGDLAVGASRDRDGGKRSGAVWVLWLDPGAEVLASRKIAADDPALGGGIAPGDELGSSLAALGDVGDDGTLEIAAGAPGDGQGLATGALWVLTIDRGGSLVGARRIPAEGSDLDAALRRRDQFGAACAALGDLNGDGLAELAVGVPGHRFEARWRGGLWVFGLGAAVEVSYAILSRPPFQEGDG